MIMIVSLIFLFASATLAKPLASATVPNHSGQSSIDYFSSKLIDQQPQQDPPYQSYEAPPPKNHLTNQPFVLDQHPPPKETQQRINTPNNEPRRPPPQPPYNPPKTFEDAVKKIASHLIATDDKIDRTYADNMASNQAYMGGVVVANHILKKERER